MRKVLGLAMIIAGVVLGVWLGVWVMFIGGIVQIVDAFQVSPISGLDIGVGLVRVLGTTFVGGASAAILIIPGWAMLTIKPIVKKRASIKLSDRRF